VNWTDENDLVVSTDLTYNFDMPDENVSLTANFETCVTDAVQLQAALDNPNVSVVNFCSDITGDVEANIEGQIIDGHDYTLTGSLTKVADNVTTRNLTINPSGNLIINGEDANLYNVSVAGTVTGTGSIAEYENLIFYDGVLNVDKLDWHDETMYESERWGAIQGAIGTWEGHDNPGDPVWIPIADEGNTILVGKGVYEEALRIRTDGITVKSVGGPEVTTIDVSNAKHYTYQPQPRTVSRAIDLEADNLRIEGFTVTGFVEMAFNAVNDGFEIVNNIVPEGEGTSGWAAYAVYIWGPNGGLVENNDLGTQPVAANDTTRTISVLEAENIVIINNKITHEEIESGVVGSEVAIDGSSNITVEGNTIEGFDGSIAIAVSGHFAPTSDVFILNNDIKNNLIGVRVGHPTSNNNDITGVQVNQNNIVGNEDYGVAHYHGDEVDATENWWGTTVETEIADLVEGDVVFDPWLDFENPDAGAN